MQREATPLCTAAQQTKWGRLVTLRIGSWRGVAWLAGRVKQRNMAFGEDIVCGAKREYRPWPPRPQHLLSQPRLRLPQGLQPRHQSRGLYVGLSRSLPSTLASCRIAASAESRADQALLRMYAFVQCS